MPYHNLIKAKFSQELHLNNTDCHHKQCEAKELVTRRVFPQLFRRKPVQSKFNTRKLLLPPLKYIPVVYVTLVK